MRIQYLISLCLLGSLTLLAQDEETTTRWEVTSGIKYLNKYTNYGLNLSDDLPALSYAAGIAHESGLSSELTILQYQHMGIQQLSVGVEYELPLNDWFSLSAGYTYNHHANDSLNILSGLVHELSLSAGISLSTYNLGISYTTFLGNNSGTYFTFDISGYHSWNRLIIVPLIQTTIISQQIENTFIQEGKKKKGMSSSTTITSTTTVTGINSASIHLVLTYPLLSHLDILAHPFLLYTPNSDISTKQYQFLWSFGVRYSTQF